MAGRSTKAGTLLATRVRITFANAPAGHAILKNFVGWAYANGHDVPQTPDEIAALSLIFKTLLNDGRAAEWMIADFQRMKRARRERQAWRARMWWRIYKTMQRTLPMK